MVENEDDFGGGLFPEDLTLQIAFVDADYQRHSGVIGENSFG